MASLKTRYGFMNPFKPDPLSHKVVNYCNRGHLLDVGCGEGADSAFFARRGFRVTAFDANADYIKRFRAYARDHDLSQIAIRRQNAVTYRYPRAAFDAVISFLVFCCMKRSEFERVLEPVKRAVRPGGIVAIAVRNALDPEFKELQEKEKPVEQNTYHDADDCCKFLYFFEPGRLRDSFNDFEVLYYFEGTVPCKYKEAGHKSHGDSHIIARRPG
ncbi:MAG: class I SAM-dependent methyltransferase [bacterium]